MAKTVFRIVTPGIHPRTGAPFFINFETDISTIDLLTSDLNDGQLLLGYRLITRFTSEQGVLEVVGRDPVSIRLDGVARIEQPSVRFVEYEGEAR